MRTHAWGAINRAAFENKCVTDSEWSATNVKCDRVACSVCMRRGVFMIHDMGRVSVACDRVARQVSRFGCNHFRRHIARHRLASYRKHRT